MHFNALNQLQLMLGIVKIDASERDLCSEGEEADRGSRLTGMTSKYFLGDMSRNELWAYRKAVRILVPHIKQG